MNQFIDKIAAIVGPQGIITDQKDIDPYTRDWRGRYHGKTFLVVQPGSTEEVSQVVKFCAANQIAIVPQGGNTGLCGASVPRENGHEIIINLKRMKQIRHIDRENNTITVDAGCFLAQVQESAAAIDRLFPLSFGSEGQCQIGGNLSTNAGGVAVLRYGNIRAMTLGLEVVLPNGEIWDGLRGLYKDNTGYDLKQLFIGAEGTLGIITAAVLKLFPRPKGVATAFIGLKGAAMAIRLLELARNLGGDKFTSFEFIPRICLDLVFKHFPALKEPLDQIYPAYVLAELSDTSTSDVDQIMHDLLTQAKRSIKEIEFAIAKNQTQAQQFWAVRKKIADAERAEGVSVKHDISVPVSKIVEFLEKSEAALKTAFPKVEIIGFGHLGDGNIHYNAGMAEPDSAAFVARESQSVNRIVYDIVARLGGSISAEHGLGQLKRDTIKTYRSAIEIEMMRAIKHTLDPHNIMNPGKVL
jgi:FAD/FMN-containing dehydrogenase